MLNTYNGKDTEVVGEVVVKIRKANIDKSWAATCTLIVTGGEWPPLLGRDLMSSLGLTTNEVTETNTRVESAGSSRILSVSLRRFCRDMHLCLRKVLAI